MILVKIRDITIIVGWPLLVFGCIYVFVKGRQVYQLVKDSLVGKLTKALVYMILVNLSTFGIVCTVYVFADPKGLYIVGPVFAVWFVVLVWTLRTIVQADKETRKLFSPEDFSKKKG